MIVHLYTTYNLALRTCRTNYKNGDYNTSNFCFFLFEQLTNENKIVRTVTLQKNVQLTG